MFDKILAGGTVIDGTGTESGLVDVGLRGDRIAAIGELSQAEARERIDVAGSIVCPGFIDPHNHADTPSRVGVRTIPEADNLIRQGITTIICGHCGGASLPIGELYDQVEQVRFHSNFATLAGYPSVLATARGITSGEPHSAEEHHNVREILRQCMRDGALGMSTCLLGQPQSRCSTRDLAEAARAVAEFGGVYDSHIRDEGEWGRHLDAIREVVDIARHGGLPGRISHIKLWGRRAWGDADKVLEILDAAQHAGLDVSCDQYPYEGGFRGMSGLLAALRSEFSEAELYGNRKDKAIHEIQYQLEQLGGPEKIICCPFDNDQELNGKTVGQVADERGIAAEECAWQPCQRPQLSACWLAMREEEVRQFMRSPHVIVGTDSHLRELNDGHCHPRCYGVYPRILGRYVREQKMLTMPEAVRKMTSMPAEKYGIKQRGVLREGNFADVVVFDPATVIDKATWAEPHQYPDGILHVLVNGEFAVRDSRATSALPGRTLRHGG